MDSMQGKTVLVTGASRGIGRVTAESLAKMGARVVLLCRDRARGEEAVASIRQNTPGAKLDLLLADLSRPKEVVRVAGDFKRTFDRLDVLVNNAGAIFSSREETQDGIERTFALNHLSYFLLTRELRDLLAATAPSRVISVSSGVHPMGRVDFDDLQFAHGYATMGAYATTKLENILFTYELARRLSGTRVTANCLHPGAVASNFGRNNGGVFEFLMKIGSPFLRSEARGAKTSIYLASSPDVDGISGKYFVDSKPKSSSKASYDEAIATRLWNASEELIEKILRTGSDASRIVGNTAAAVS